MSTDRVTEWIQDRRETRIGVPGSVTFGSDNHGDALLLVDGCGVSEHGELVREILDAYKELPKALTALEQVLELIEFMETDAENYLNAGHLHASEVLLENAGDLRQAIEGAINE